MKRIYTPFLLIGMAMAGIVYIKFTSHPVYVSPYKNTTTVAEDQALLHFQETIFNFGVVTAGAVANHAFIFTNVGKKPLIIYEVLPSCNQCTKASCLQLVTQPGSQGTIVVEFNSAGRFKKQAKYVTILSNATNSPHRLLIRGVVEKP